METLYPTEFYCSDELVLKIDEEGDGLREYQVGDPVWLPYKVDYNKFGNQKFWVTEKSIDGGKQRVSVALASLPPNSP